MTLGLNPIGLVMSLRALPIYVFVRSTNRTLDNKRHLEEQDKSERAEKKLKAQETEHTDCVLSPDMTANEVMELYTPLFSPV